jgi:hypothetical protein
MDWVQVTNRMASKIDDLTTLDFFFWAHLKSLVKHTQLCTTLDLKENIHAANTDITLQTLEHV